MGEPDLVGEVAYLEWRIHGELARLGFAIAASTVWKIPCSRYRHAHNRSLGPLNSISERRTITQTPTILTRIGQSPLRTAVILNPQTPARAEASPASR